MRIAVLSVALLVATHQPARACPDADLIPDWIVYPIGAGVVGGYAYGTAYFGLHDLADDRRDNDYLTGDLAFNGVMGSIFGLATVEAAKDHSASVVPLAAMTVLHGSMVVHAASRLSVDLHNFNGTAAAWGIGTAYALETLVFIDQSGEHHGRTYGLVEASVQTPIAAGLAYLAYDRGREGKPEAILFGGMAALSGALAYHGMKTAISPYVEPKLDVLGTDIMPTVVDDGRELGAGIAASRTW